MYPFYGDRYGGGDDRRYSSFPDRVGLSRFGDRDLDDFRRFGRHDIGAPPLREEDWRSSSYIQREEPAYVRPYESWKSRPVNWREERESESWRRRDDERYREHTDWRRESFVRERSPPPRFVASPHEFPRTRRRSPKWNEKSRESFKSRNRYSRGGSGRNGSVSLGGRPAKETRNSVLEDSLKNLSEEELEKAAILQMRLMAAQEDEKGQIDAHSNDREKVDNNQSLTTQNSLEYARVKEVNEEEEQSKSLNQKEVKDSSSTSRTANVETIENAAEEKETAGDSKKSSQTKREHIAEAKEASNRKNEGGSLIVKAAFEDVHMFAKHKIYDASSAGPQDGTAGGLSWYEQYLMNVNKRKKELQSGTIVSPPLSQTSTSYGRANGPRYPPPLPGYVPGSPDLDVHAVKHVSQMSSSSTSPLYMRQERTPTSGSLIDPNQYIEELSDNEDWDNVGRPVSKMPLKREAEVPMERPPKRSLLGGPPPSISPPVLASNDPWQRPSVLASKSLYSKSTPSVSFTHPAEKSFFRMEIPSVPPRIYFSHKLGEQEDEPEATPPQARIAPAAPLPRDDGHYTSWRRTERGPRRSASSKSKYGGYFH